MSLCPAQKSSFKRDGFVHLPGAVAPELVESALHAINYRVGRGIPAEELAVWQSQSFFPDLQKQPVITDLFNASGLRATLQELMGPENVAAMKGGQLALRFPTEPGAQMELRGGHIDGIYSPNNGVIKGTLSSFSALVGVFLTDVDRDFAGNFTIWPGSHRKMEEYFRAHGTDIITQKNRTPPIDQGEPLQIRVKAGDAVLAHYQLLHTATPNGAPRPRYATFFRVIHPAHESHKLECLCDLWREWPGIQT